jgi:predicted PurR-regulated permease PerM
VEARRKIGESFRTLSSCPSLTQRGVRRDKAIRATPGPLTRASLARLVPRVVGVTDTRETPPATPDTRRAGGGPAWRQLRPLAIFAGLVLATAVLYAAQAVLIPVVLAMLLAFLLNPLVKVLERRIGRAIAVFLVVILVFSAVAAVGWGLWWQSSNLAHELPKYRENILRRVAVLRGATKGSAIERLGRTAKDVLSEVDGEETTSRRPPIVVREQKGWLDWRVSAAVAPVIEALVTAALVVALVVFMLARRDQMRTRLIRLVGGSRLPTATKALDETFDRISQYLLSLSIINASFGTAVGVGLFLIGLPYAVLWGFLAAALRFIPYVGVWTAALLPIALAFASFPGWLEPVLVVALFVVLEPLIAFALEPLVYSESAGVSDIGLLVALTFWTWLWGPIGLVLGTPLTVCLVVIGKHVPELDFLWVLLGEEPVVEADIRYYERLLASDQDGAEEVAEDYVRAHDAEAVYDCVLVPALSYARRDRDRERITEEDVGFVLQVTRDVVEGLAPGTETPAEGARGTDRLLVIGCPARDETDAVALAMLRHLLDPGRWELVLTSADLFSSEVVRLVADHGAPLVCVADVAPGAISRARYLVKRLRAAAPDVKIVVGRWGAPALVAHDLDRLREAGADDLATSLVQARERLQALATSVARAAA